MLTALLIIVRGTHIGASILFAGIFTFDLVTLGFNDRSESDEDLHELKRRLLRLAIWSLVAALLSALLWFWIEVANMSELSLKDALPTTAWQTVLFETTFGRVWQLRLGVVAVAFALIAFGLLRDKARRAGVFALWLLSVVLLVSLAWISHAAAARVQPLSKWADALHLCAAGGWIGGLVPLTIFLSRARLSFSLRGKILEVLDRYTVQSLCCVSVLVVSGVSNSWLLVGSIHALFTTVYGWFLLFKLAVFAILVGFGTRNLFTLKTGRLRARISSDLLPQLHRNVICEACLGAAVVAIVACLGVTPPARHP